MIWDRDLPAETQHDTPGAATRHSGRQFSESQIQDWLIERMAGQLQLTPEQIDTRAPFESYGLSSRQAVMLSGELEEWLGRQLSPTLAWEYPSIESMARYLAATSSTATTGTSRDERQAGSEQIAIVGIGCRFPGANGPTEFWDNLLNGVDSVSEVPRDRWDLENLYDPSPENPGKVTTRWGGFLSQVDQFDPFFFGISPKEARRIDPQHRLLLEIAWEAFEDAGIVPDQLAGSRTGVFVGISSNDYGQLLFGNPQAIDGYAGTGNALSIAANRISYLFDLKGPSLAVDTACSSSLVAVHLACQSLLNGEATMALAGGVNLMVTPAVTISMSQGGFMAPDGRCKVFDARADGYVRAEGVGLVVLKPLKRALADGDPIYALIRSSAINQDGRTNGLTAPNRQSQEALLREAYRKAAVSPGQVQYVEAHGTGTLLGDPIEVGALNTVLSSDREPGSVCALGSAKSNIGHAEAAAGIAGLIKVALALRHGVIPPSLHFEQPNPHIPFDEMPLRVQTVPAAWPERAEPALAGVSAFSFGGTNAHIVLEGMTNGRAQSSGSSRDAESYLLPLSARSPQALDALARAYQTLLDTRQIDALDDLCYSASVRRGHYEHRVALVGSSAAELSEQIDTWRRSGSTTHTPPARRNQKRKLVFVFPGQGSQWIGMGRELLRSEPVFRETIEACELAFAPHVDWSLTELLAADDDTTADRLEAVDVAQPAIFAIEVALAALWRSWGIEPDAVVGHSMGEVAAAYVAGSLTLLDAARVICHRSRLIATKSGQGKTALLGLREDQVQQLLSDTTGRVALAAVNGPASTVIAGDPAAIDMLIDRVTQQGGFARLVNVDVAAHSPQMNDIACQLERELGGLRCRLPAIPIYSSVTGQLSRGAMFDAAYWARNLHQPVLFSAAIEQMIDRKHDVFIEMSPHPILTTAIRDILQQRQAEGQALPSLRRRQPERHSLLTSLGMLYTLGYPLDFSKLYPSGGRVVSLPRYPWQRERYWLESVTAPASPELSPVASTQGRRAPLLTRRLRMAQPTWESDLDADIVATYGSSADLLLELALEALKQATTGDDISLSDMYVPEPLLIRDQGITTLQTILSPDEPGSRRLQIYGPPVDANPETGEWILHASGRAQMPDSAGSDLISEVDLAGIQTRCGTEIALTGQPTGLLRQLHVGDREAIGRLDARPSDARAILPHGLLASCLWIIQMAGFGPAAAGDARLTRIERLRLRGSDVQHARFVHLRQSSTGTGQDDLFDVRLYAAGDEPVLSLTGIHVSPDMAATSAPVASMNIATEAQHAEPSRFSTAERPGWIEERFRHELARVLGTTASRIDVHQPIDTLGIDSLMAMQLKTRIEAEFGVTISAIDFFLGPTIAELAELVSTQLANNEDDAAKFRQDPNTTEVIHTGGFSAPAFSASALEAELSRLEELSDEELDALLNGMLVEKDTAE